MRGPLLSSIVACLAPVVVAPVWEEYLYRGIHLPLLTRLTSPLLGVILSSAVFALHHMSVPDFFPLMGIGCVWALVAKR